MDKLKSSFKPDSLQTTSINQLKFAFNMIKNNKNVDDKFKTIQLQNEKFKKIKDENEYFI